jgi:pre-mRNA cleavage complex 2 protein Pcf11
MSDCIYCKVAFSGPTWKTKVLTRAQVPPARTLPALYVLDSVVKNVPTPYALYFGPKLYSIFMGAYTKVDNGTRRKMDEMLKTWKEPVPGSISTKPVFPPEHVRPIEHALVAARQAAFAANQNSFQGQQQLLRGGRPPVPPTRDTPTPPSGRPPPHQAGPHGQQQFPGTNGHPPQAVVAQPQPYPMRPLHVRV